MGAAEGWGCGLGAGAGVGPFLVPADLGPGARGAVFGRLLGGGPVAAGGWGGGLDTLTPPPPLTPLGVSETGRGGGGCVEGVLAGWREGEGVSFFLTLPGVEPG